MELGKFNLIADEYIRSLNGYHKRDRYEIDKDNESAISSIVEYYKHFRDKGIILMGTVGTGKTTIMKVIAHRTRQFGVVSCKDVVQDFNIEGFAAIEKYGNQSYLMNGTERIPIVRCFDDLGHEETSMHFGNRVDVMAQIIEQRYARGLITHFTTNLTIDLIDDKYGDRVGSRIREMCIPILLNGKDRRLSKKT